MRPSMGSVGDAYDNAMGESFFATLECELLDRCRFKTQAEARSAVFAFNRTTGRTGDCIPWCRSLAKRRQPSDRLCGELLHYRHAFRRAAASLISASGPQYEKRRKRLPRAWSKSTPGVTAIPTSASTRAQNAALSFDRSAISANR